MYNPPFDLRCQSKICVKLFMCNKIKIIKFGDIIFSFEVKEHQN